MIIHISATDKELRIVRTYFSLITMLSQIGGISRIVFIVFGLFYFGYNRFSLKKKILDGVIDTKERFLPEHYLDKQILEQILETQP